MTKLSSFRIDPELERDGKWFTYEGEVRFLIARIGNPRYSEYVRERAAEGEVASDGTIDVNSTEWDRVHREAMGHAVLLGWEGLEEDDGSPLEYSPERSAALLSDPEYPEIYVFVAGKAMQRRNFRSRAKEQRVGESVGLSGGNSSGASTPDGSRRRRPQAV